MDMAGAAIDYEYQALPDGPYIRCLTLQPGRDDDALVCTIEISHLDSVRPFEAISYVWGTAARQCEITCDGKRMFITQNLEDALKRLRRPVTPRSLWADSVCINQGDRIEQGRQVAVMGRIFSTAEQVLIVLGYDDGRDGGAIKSLVADVSQLVGKGLETLDSSWDNFPYPLRTEPLLSDKRWISLRVLLQQPWFSRGWVVQEAGLAKRATILWGSIEIPWPDLVRTCLWVARRAPQVSFDHGMGVMPELHCQTFRLGWERDARALRPKSDWLELDPMAVLQHGRAFGLTDKRDRIYPFIPLIERFSKEPFTLVKPDYERDFLEVYDDFAKRYLTSTNDLTLLDCVQHHGDTADSKISTWVPRWDLHHFSDRVGDSWAVPIKSQFNSTVPPRILPDGVLQVRGVLLESVAFTSNLILRHDTSIDDVAQIFSDMLGIQSESPYPAAYWPLALTTVLTLTTFVGDWQNWVANRAAYLLQIVNASDRPTVSNDAQGQLESQSVGGNALFFHDVATENAHNRRVIMMKDGYYGVAPCVAQVGDKCAIIFGTRAPVLLRETEDPGRYKILGQVCLASKYLVSIEESVAYHMVGRGTIHQDWIEAGVEEQDIFLV